MKQIKLTQGKVALIDDEDYESVSKHKWCAQKIGNTYYAACYVNYSYIYMHRLIMQSPPEFEIDHKDLDGLNNQRSNLRVCSRTQNMGNRNKRSGSTSSKYKGVSWHTRANKWVAQINKDKKTVYLGLFKNEEEAAKKYDEEALKVFGEFARTNF